MQITQTGVKWHGSTVLVRLTGVEEFQLKSLYLVSNVNIFALQECLPVTGSAEHERFTSIQRLLIRKKPTQNQNQKQTTTTTTTTTTKEKKKRPTDRHTDKQANTPTDKHLSAPFPLTFSLVVLHEPLAGWVGVHPPDGDHLPLADGQVLGTATGVVLDHAVSHLRLAVTQLVGGGGEVGGEGGKGEGETEIYCYDPSPYPLPVTQQYGSMRQNISQITDDDGDSNYNDDDDDDDDDGDSNYNDDDDDDNNSKDAVAAADNYDYGDNDNSNDNGNNDNGETIIATAATATISIEIKLIL